MNDNDIRFWSEDAVTTRERDGWKWILRLWTATLGWRIDPAGLARAWFECPLPVASSLDRSPIEDAADRTPIGSAVRVRLLWHQTMKTQLQGGS